MGHLCIGYHAIIGVVKCFDTLSRIGDSKQPARGGLLGWGGVGSIFVGRGGRGGLRALYDNPYERVVAGLLFD